MSSRAKSANTQKFKVVLLGEGRVGKTSCVLRYVKNTFDERQVSTIQASYLDKRVNVNEQGVNLAIWDTAGQERFHSLGPIYYREANGALLVYDITDKDSFTKVQNWVKELRRMVGKDIVIAIAGNKLDLERNRQVDEEEAQSYADSVGAVHMGTSAKLGKGVDEIFLELTKRMLKKSASAKKTDGRRPTVMINPGELPEKKSSGGCC